MLATQIRSPESSKNSIGGYVSFGTELVPSVFIQALNWFWQQCDAERMRLDRTQQRWAFEYCPDGVMPDPIQIDFSDAGDPQAAALSWMQGQMACPIELAAFPLFEHAIVRVSTNEYYYFSRNHHIICDGFSFFFKINMVSRCYTELVGQNSALAVMFGSCRDELERCQLYLASPDRLDDLSYWRGRLGQAQPTLWPAATLAESRALTMERIECAEHYLSEPFCERIAAFVAATRVSPMHLLLTAVAATLARTSGQTDVTFGVPVHNRTSRIQKATSGGFSSILPVRIRLLQGSSVADNARAVAIALGQDLTHRRLPLWDIVRQYRVDHPGRERLFDTIVNYEPFQPVSQRGSLDVKIHELSSEFEHVPLRVTYLDYRGAQQNMLRVELKSGYHSDDARQLTEALIAELEAMIDDAAYQIGDSAPTAVTNRNTLMKLRRSA
jgi:hypothetical protein